MLRKTRHAAMVAILLGTGGSALSQTPDDPFGPTNVADPFSAAGMTDPFMPPMNDPFTPGAPTGGGIADPFSAAPAGGANPFAPAPAADPFTPSFGAAPASNPFAPAPPPPAGVGAPFGQAAPATPGVADPFSAGPTGGMADPFSAAPTGAVSDPFGAAPAAGSPFAGGFGAPAPTGGAFDPFGGPAASGTEGAFNPFGAPAPGGDESSPFALPDAPSAPSDGTSITRLFQFRFMETRRMDGERTVIRRAMTREEAEAFDNTIKDHYRELAGRNELPGYTAGVDDLEDWLDWLAYAYQTRLWRQYCETIVLVGADFDSSTVRFRFPGDPDPNAAPAQGGAGLEAGGRPQRPDNIINENRSLDDQLQDFNPLADTRPGGQGRTVFDPSQMNDQTRTIYNQYLQALRGYEEFQEGFIRRLLADLDDRANKRRSYQEWRDGQLDLVMEYVEEWNRRYVGDVTIIAGVRYELYSPENVPTQTVRGANIVVTDYGLTPYDILNEDGTLRGPSKQ